MIDLDNIKFTYLSPSHLLSLSKWNYDIAIAEEGKEYGNSLFAQTNFAVSCAASAEAHLNWYRHFVQEVDIDGPRVSIKNKIMGAPLSSKTKGELNAIFKVRDKIMHPKYKPKDAHAEFKYEHIMAKSFMALVNCCSELLNEEPGKLTGRIGLDASHLQIRNHVEKLRMETTEGGYIDWVDLVKKDLISLPIVRVIDVK